MLNHVPQRLALWLALRDDLIGTSSSTVLGFRANCKIAAMRALPDIHMRDGELAELHVDALPRAMAVHGVDVSALPRLTATPDGVCGRAWAGEL